MTGQRQSFIVGGCVATLLAAIACGKVDFLTRSPGDTVKEAYMAANAGRYSEAETLMSLELLNLMQGGLGALAGGTKGVFDKITRDGTIDRIEILKEEVRGEGAKVYFRIHYDDGKTEDDDEDLIMREGQWKITVER